MNLCKSGIISARTKSLREKFSRNRSYSELSFKETNTTSSLVSTPTESCSGSLANASSQGTFPFKRQPQQSSSTNVAAEFYNNESYCSALDLSSQPPLFDEPRFPWQRDVAIQCDLLAAPLVSWPPITKKLKDQSQPQHGAKKKTSSSSTSSAASTLINAAAATLRMTGLTDSSSGSSTGVNTRFWKSSLLLPSFNVSNVADKDQTDCGKDNNLRRQKSFKWASASVVRRPVLKRAASFDSRGGYARLVQSTSSPNSPPGTLDYDPPHSALPVMSVEHDNTSSKGKPSCEGSQMAQSASSSGGLFWNSSSLSNSVRPTALLGASAAMTAAAPFTAAASLLSPKLGPETGNPSNNATSNTPTSTSNHTVPRRKMSSHEISLKELRRKQFLVSRKQPSSAPDSFDDDSNHSPSREKSYTTTNVSSLSGENELYNYNTVHRLLNISLSASNCTTDNVIKPFLLELPDVSNTCHPNLPSPNVQSEIQEVNPVLRKLSVLSRAPHKALASRLSDSSDKKKQYLDLDDDFFDDEENEMLPEEPPAAALQRRRRRRALVPPKLITDGYESANEYELNKSNRDEPRVAKSGDADQASSVDDKVKDCVTEGSEAQVGHGSSSSMVAPNVTIDTIDDQNDNGVLGESNDALANKSPPKTGQNRTPSHHHNHNSSSNSSSSGASNSNHLGANLNRLEPGPSNKNRRRSSVVVIPPMQICPGDLLVYSKVLSQRSNMIDNLEGSFSSALLTEQEHSRKSHKNTWSLLRLFDRSNSRNKAAADQILCGLEEVLANLQPSNSFVDESMLRYRGISWNEFLVRLEERRVSNASTSFASATSSLVTSASAAAAAAATATMGLGCSRFFHGARFSSLQSNALDTANSANTTHVCKKISLPCGGISRAMQQNLERVKAKQDKAKTFDTQAECLISSEANQQERGQLKRAESCSTVSDVESIVENFELSPLKTDEIGQAKLADETCHNAIEEELSGDKYDSESFCCNCMQISKREQRRREALWELFQSDLLFLTEHLMVLKNVFMEPLKNIQVEGYAMFAEPEVLFGNLDELCLVTYAFCREFLNILLSQSNSGDLQVTTILAKLFQQSGRAAALTQAYHRYTLNYINALNYLETLRRQIEFSEFEKWCNRDTRCKKLQLTDLLVAPVQHVMRVPLLLKEIENRTHEPSEKATIVSIIEEQEHSLRELDDKMRWLKNFERLLEIQRNIIWPSVIDMDPKVFVPEFLKSLLAKQPCERLIVSPRRQIVLEGPLMVLDSGKPIEMYVFLFDDLILITRRKKGLGKKQSTLTERWVSNCSGRNSSFSSVVSVGGASSTVSGSVSSSTSTSTSAASAVVNAASATAATSGSITATGEPNHGPLPGGGGTSLFKYVVYKQPLSLDRFYIHDILPTTEGAANLRHGFVLVCLNRFQQVITLHTFQAASESAKNTWLTKLRDTSDRWKRTLQTNVFRNSHGGQGTGAQSQHQGTGEKASSSTFGNRLNLNNFQLSSHKSSLYQRNKSPPSRRPTTFNDPRMSSGSVSMSSSLRDNASCSYVMDDSILTTSTFT